MVPVVSSILTASYTLPNRILPNTIPNPPNPNPILPNLITNIHIPNSPSIIPSSSYTYDEAQTMVYDANVQEFFKLPSPSYLIHNNVKGKRKELPL